MHIKSFSQKDRYGNSISIEFQDDSIPEMQAIPMPNFKPKGTDTVPAMLTPGEFVMNAEATRMFEPQIEAMNNAGRQVQEMQGGSIPEGGNIPGEPAYKGDGGFLSGLTSTVSGAIDNLTLPPAPPGIVYRRLEDGSIGKFTERSGSGGGQTYLGRLESAKPKKRRDDTWNFSSLYKDEGGYVMPDFLSDEQIGNALAGIYETETNSGANVKESSAGAIGPMQILPSTAANPGYGVKPRTVKDISTLEGSQAFAKDYLRGIHKANPDFDLNQTITAYHSGAGNVRKDKDGVEPLGPVGQSYGNKVLSFMSELNPLRVGEVQASTLKEPPKPDEDEGGFFDFLKGKPNPNNVEFNRKASNLNRDKVAADFKAMEAKRLANIEAGRNEFENINEKTYNGLKKAVEFQNQEVKKSTEESLALNKVDPGLADAAKKVEEEKAEKALVPSIAEMEIIKSDGYQDHVARSEAAGKIPKPPSEWIELHTPNAEDSDGNQSAPIDRMTVGKSETVDNNKNEVSAAVEKQKVAEGVQNATDQDSNEVDENKVNELLENHREGNQGNQDDGKGNNEEVNDIVDKVGGWFSDMFSDLFSGPELARMIVMYAGSRALGYSHNGSLNYSMKNYLTRVDANVAAREEFVNSGEAIENYTAESLAKYRKSGDRNDLVGKNLGMKKTAGNIYMPGVGKMQVFADKNGKEYIEFEGNTIPIEQVKGLVEPWDEDVHGDKALASDFSSAIEDSVDIYNNEYDFGDDEKLVVRKTDIANKAAGIMRNVMRRNGVSINESEPFKAAIRGGIDDYIKAKAEAKKNGTKMPMSLEAFIERRSYQPLTGISQSQVNNTSVENLRSLNQMIKREMTNKKASDPKYNEEYKADWNATFAAYSKLAPEVRAKFEKDAARKKGWNGFTLWMSKTPADEIVEILKQQ